MTMRYTDGKMRILDLKFSQFSKIIVKYIKLQFWLLFTQEVI